MIDRRTSQRSLVGTVDWVLIVCWMILAAIGLLNVYSTVHYDYPDLLVWESRACKQLIWIGTAVVMALILMFVIPTRVYENASVPLYALMFLLLVGVIFIADDTKGSRSWIELGSIKIQPAEFSKITTSMMIANVINKLDLRFNKFRDYAIAAAVLLLPMLAIVGENETGSMLVYAGFIFVLYREGISGWWLALLGAVIVLFIVTLRFGIPWALLSATIIAGFIDAKNNGRMGLWMAVSLPVNVILIVWTSVYPGICESHPEGLVPLFKPIYFILAVIAAQIICYIVFAIIRRNSFRTLCASVLAACVISSFSVNFVFNNVLQAHQQKRIEVLLGIIQDTSGWGYNVHQSKVAIGSGGFFGKGYLNGTQSTFGFVPEQTTDFIFCTIGEEWGFVGSAAVVLLYVILIFRIIHDAELSRLRFIRVYGYCVASCFFMHLIINIGMTIGLMPVIGIPLPFVSYGGSSMWAFTIMLFIFVAMSRDERKYF